MAQQDNQHLQERIEKARKSAGLEDVKSKPKKREVNPWNAAIELVSSVAVGAGLGFAIDRWLGTSPGFIITLFLFGFIVGIYNIYRLASSDNSGKNTARKW